MSAAAGRVALVGMSGSGKSAVARVLAKLLGLPALDVDAMAAQEAGMPVAEIFEVQGEEAFRRLEHACIAKALSGPPCVVAIGAGAVEWAPSQAFMRGVAFAPFCPSPAAQGAKRGSAMPSSLDRSAYERWPDGSGRVLFVWVDAPDAQIASRLGAGQGRPLLAQAPSLPEALAKQRQRREPLYRELAAVRHGSGLSGAPALAAALASAMASREAA